MAIPPYPLQWPDTMPRHSTRERSRFKTALSTATNNVRKSIVAFGSDSGKPVQDLVISSNVTLGVDSPADPGVAVWFKWDGQQVCIAVDRYDKLEHNLQAIHHIVEGRRTEPRHGGLNIVRQTFRGFAALPGPAAPDWRSELGFPRDAKPTRDQIDAAYCAKAKTAHPDGGGSDVAFQRLQQLYQQAKAAVG